MEAWQIVEALVFSVLYLTKTALLFLLELMETLMDIACHIEIKPLDLHRGKHWSFVLFLWKMAIMSELLTESMEPLTDITCHMEGKRNLEREEHCLSMLSS